MPSRSEAAGSPGSPSLRALPGGRSGRRAPRRRLPMYPDVRKGPRGWVEGPAADLVGTEFLWAWQYDTDNPAVYLPARWSGRSSDPPPGPGAALILDDNRLWCASEGPAPRPVRARLLLSAQELAGMATVARQYWPTEEEKR